MPARTRILTIALVVGLLVGAFTLGAAFIFIGSLEVANRFDVHGQPTVIAGQPAHFRVMAFTDDPPGPLVGATVELVLEQTEVRVAVPLDRRGEGVVVLPVPATLEPGTHTMLATLTDSGEELEAMPFELEVTGNEVVVGVAEQAAFKDHGEGELRIELITGGGYVVPHLDNPAFVRVTTRDTWEPVAAQVTVELAYGQLQGATKVTPQTDALGLAETHIRPISETDWKLSASAADGRSGSVDRTLSIYATAIVADAAIPQVVGATPVRFTVETTRSGGELYADIVADGAWIATHHTVIGDTPATISFRPHGLQPPPDPRLAVLVTCFSSISCDDANARLPLVWSATPMDARERLEAMAGFVEVRGIDVAYVQKLRAAVRRGGLTGAALNRATRALGARIPTEYPRPKPLLRSEPIAAARLVATKDRFRGALNVLFVLLCVAGGLFLGTTVARGSARRRRAMGEVLLDAIVDDGIDVDTIDLPPGQGHALAVGARRQAVAVAIDIAVLTLTIIVFLGGILLLMQKL